MTIKCPHCNEPNEIKRWYGIDMDGAIYRCECGYEAFQDDWGYSYCYNIVENKIEEERKRAYNGIEPGEDNS